MARRGPILLLRAVATGGALLALLVAALWPIGYRHAYLPTVFHVGVGVIGGRVYAIYNTEDVPFWPPAMIDGEVEPDERPFPVPHEWMGFGAGVAAGSGEGRACAPVPAAIVALLAAAAASWALANRTRRDARTGRCPACGYDCRATPDRCPECGAVPVQAT